MTPKRKVNPLLHQWARDVSLQPCVAFRMYGGGFFFFRNRASRQSYIEIDSIDPHTSTWCKDMMYTYIHVRNPSSLFGRWWLRGKKTEKKMWNFLFDALTCVDCALDVGRMGSAVRSAKPHAKFAFDNGAIRHLLRGQFCRLIIRNRRKIESGV